MDVISINFLNPQETRTHSPSVRLSAHMDVISNINIDIISIYLLPLNISAIIFIIAPPFWDILPVVKHSRHIKNVPVKLVSTTACHPFLLISYIN